MAAYLTAEKVKIYKEQNPGIPAVVYVNSTAAVKAESDICCTSSNAVNIVKKISKEFNVDAVLFGPDTHLADFAEQNSGIKTIKMPPEGNCYVHAQITAEDIISIKNIHKKAKLLVHPECIREVRDRADFVGSTAQMYNAVKQSNFKEREFIIGTEIGLLKRMAQDFPDKKFYPVIDKLICYNMKKHNLELIKYLLEHPEDQNHEVKVPSDIAVKALLPIEKMLEYS
jgi:quinolinate synthase